MNKSLYLIFFLVGSIFLTCNSMKETTDTPMQSDPRWSEVDSLETKGLYRSCWEIVNEIYGTAFERGDFQTQYKALCYQLKYADKVEEGSALDAIENLARVADTSDMPLNAIAHSMAAEAYWAYYQQHRWEILQRTPAPGIEDIKFWDLGKFIDEIDGHFSKSLVNSSQLRSILIKDLSKELITDSVNAELRPSLYEMLAYRALGFYKNSESGLTRPKDFFLIDRADYYSSGSSFSEMDVPRTDTLSFRYRAVRIYQDLLRMQTSGSQAWLSTNLERLQFISANSSLSDKAGEVSDVYLLKALDREIESGNRSPIIGEYAIVKAQLYSSSGNGYAFGKDLEKKQHYRTAETICQKVIEEHPETRASQLAKTHLSDIRQKSLQLTVEEVMIPNFSGLAKVAYRNLEKTWLRVVSVPHDFMADERYDQEKYVRLLCKQPIVAEWSLGLPEAADHHQHTIETKIPALDHGHYAIIASEDEEFKNNEAKSYSLFWVTHIAMQEGPHPSGGSKIHLQNRESGADLSGAEIIHYIIDYDRNSRKQVATEYKRYSADSQGRVHIPYVQDHYNQSLDITWNGELYHIGFYSRAPFQNERAYETTQYFLDRSIYRPGQTLYLKGIHMQNGPGGPQIMPDKDIEVTLRDANYQEVVKQSFRSNEFGSFSGTFTLPSAGLTGQMTLQSAHGSTSFSVEEYKRPKFKVELDSLEGVYSLGASVGSTGRAIGYNGAPIADAQVRYTVQRKPVYIWKWAWWNRMPSYDSSPVLITNGYTKSDAQGKFELEFDAVAGNQNGGGDFSHYSFEITVDVTDINGETRSAAQSIGIGEIGLLLNSTMPAEIDRSSIPSVKIRSTNLNGKDVNASGQWEIRKRKTREKIKVDRRWEITEFQGVSESEFRNELPLFYFDLDEAMPDPEGDLIASGEWNTAVDQQMDKSSIASLASGEYIFKLNAGGPEEVEYSKEFLVFDVENGPTPFRSALKVLDTSAPYLPGDDAEIMISSNWEDMQIHIEFEHDKKIFREEDITLNKGQAILTIPITSPHQEGLFIHLTTLRHNRAFKETLTIEVTPIDRLLNVSLETYRDKMLPGSAEQWRIKVDAQNGDEAISEMLLSMYDASLDQFKIHNWSFSPWRTGVPMLNMDYKGFGTAYSKLHSPGWYIDRSYVSPRQYPSLNRFGYQPQFYSTFGNRGEMLNEVSSMADGDVRKMSRSGGREDSSLQFDSDSVEAEMVQDESAPPSPPKVEGDELSQGSGPQVRSNFKETAFFYPDLRTDPEGDLIFSFTMPESLTTWKFQALAHSKKLQSGLSSQEVITQKDLMVVPNVPRFLREGDKIVLSTKLVSLSKEVENGTIRLELFDAVTMKEISTKMISGDQSLSFSIDGGESRAFEWSVDVPDDHAAISYRFIAEGTKHSDGEEDALPVLSNRMLMTEAMPFALLKENEKEFEFTRMNEVNTSNTLEPYNLTLEFTANPIWYAVQAMPYMMEYPYDCSEQIFTRYYSNSLASNIINERPRLREVIDSWKDLSPDAFLSNLEKNQELKYVILEETPWVMEAKDESERKKRLSLLLDVNHMAQRQKQALDKLIQAQGPSGGWPWFAGMRPNLYITQYILSGLGHLKHLGVLDDNDPRLQQMIVSALEFMDEQHLDRWVRMKRYDKDWKKNDHTGPFEIQYLYARSFYRDGGLPQNEAFSYYKNQAAEFWLSKGVYMQGMSALALHRMDNPIVAKDIMRSVKEQSMMGDDLGMYWKDQSNGWYWYQAGIERHALLVEAFSEIMDDDESVYGLKQWLIFNKQTNDWETTRATAEACYALLLGGSDWTQDREWSIAIGSEKFESTDPSLKTEAGTGYFKRKWGSDDIKDNMSNVKVVKEGEAPAWGALYYQYFEQLDKISTAESPLKIRKEVFKVTKTDTGEELITLEDQSTLSVGDRVRVRMEIETDREMEYVHIKDMRSSGMEPVNVISQMVYSGGLGFYRNTRDAATNFFIDDLRKGAYVLEYDLFVSHKGDFSNGVTTIQCMYAPEFTAHSSGIRVVVE